MPIMTKPHITSISTLLSDLLHDYATEIDRAYLKAEGKLTISTSIKLRGDMAEVGIAFSQGKIKDGGKINLQGELQAAGEEA